MESINIDIGNWTAKAKIQETDSDTVIIMISVESKNGEIEESKHTVVFEHKDGVDQTEEAREMVLRLLKERYSDKNDFIVNRRRAHRRSDPT